MSTETAASTGRLPVRVKLGFGVADLGGNLFFTALGFYALKYLTDTVGIAAAVAGTILMVGKFVDAFWDPLIGFISDNTRTRFGRRRPFLLFGSIPMALTMWFFFTNPHIQQPGLLVAWGLVAFILLNVTYSVVNIPYSSLTPELTTDYNERSSLNGFRFMFAVVGTILGAVAVEPIIGIVGSGHGGDKSLGFSIVGAIFGAVMLVTALITGLSVREPPVTAAKAEKDFVKAYLKVFKNGPFRIVLFGYALHLVGLTFLQTAITYYFTYIYNNEAMQTLAMGILLIVAMVFIPISVLVSKRIGKKLTWQICFFILGTSSLALFFLGHRLGPNFFLAMMVYSGIGVGFGYVAPYAMLPDAIEVDAIRSGKRNEGAFYGLYLLTSKVGQALALLLTGLVLTLGHYIPNVPQSETAKLAIRVLVGPLPAIVLLGALVLVQFYPLDEKTYEKILAEEGAKKE